MKAVLIAIMCLICFGCAEERQTNKDADKYRNVLNDKLIEICISRGGFPIIDWGFGGGARIKDCSFKEATHD